MPDRAQVAVLGSTGMLGSMVVAWLVRSSGSAVRRFARDPQRESGPCVRFDAEAFLCDPDGHGERLTGVDFIINCIGIIKPWCRDDDPADGLYESIARETPSSHFVPNPIVTKFELLEIFADVYNSPCTIERVEVPGPPINRTLATRLPPLTALQPAKSMFQAVEELREFSSVLQGGARE